MKAARPCSPPCCWPPPASAQDDRTWFFIESEEGVRLQYGTSESDDVLATFTSYKDSGSVELYLTFAHRVATENPTQQGDWLEANGHKAPWPVDLTTDGLSVAANANEMNGGGTLSIVAKTDAPAFALTATVERLEAEAFGGDRRPSAL